MLGILMSAQRRKLSYCFGAFVVASLLLICADVSGAVSPRILGFLFLVLLIASSLAIFYIFWSENRKTDLIDDRGEDRQRLEKGIHACHLWIGLIATGTAWAIMNFNRSELLFSAAPIVMGLVFIVALLITRSRFKRSLKRLEEAKRHR